MVTTTNLSTGMEVSYLVSSPLKAVMLAYRQYTLKDWNTWEYTNESDMPVTTGKHSVACGNWCAVL